jgi:hypothetical protein
MPKPPFSYEPIADLDARSGFHYRIRDANDDRIGTSYLEANAQFIVDALNTAHPITDYHSPRR